jgi:hypothetical protein
MLLSDAINAARTEHEIFFLLTSYIDALGHSVSPGSVPDAVLALPLAGRSDLERRAAELGCQLDDDLSPRRRERRPAIAEGFSILITAVLALDRVGTEQRRRADESDLAVTTPAWLPAPRPGRCVEPESAR